MDHAHKSAQRETTWDGDHDSETIFEQRVERDEMQAIRDTDQDDWVNNVGRVGIGRKEVPYAPGAVHVCAEEDQQAGTQRHTHDGFPERVDQGLPGASLKIDQTPRLWSSQL
ncbi:MAG TPA: hypothetical protein VEH81_02025 [Ktedonobacteraceae bacterium]|nr:hypothetical protein [Ktedonobacteraceae bacterium]